MTESVSTIEEGASGTPGPEEVANPRLSGPEFDRHKSMGIADRRQFILQADSGESQQRYTRAELASIFGCSPRTVDGDRAANREALIEAIPKGDTGLAVGIYRRHMGQAWMHTYRLLLEAMRMRARPSPEDEARGLPGQMTAAGLDLGLKAINTLDRIDRHVLEALANHGYITRAPARLEVREESYRHEVRETLSRLVPAGASPMERVGAIKAELRRQRDLLRALPGPVRDVTPDPRALASDAL